MKGMVLTVYLDFAEQRVGTTALDQALVNCTLSNNGAYTSVGNYTHTDLLLLNSTIAKIVDNSKADLLKEFGRFLFAKLADGHQEMMADFHTLEALLLNLENVIHRDVRKLYPGANPPVFSITEHIPGESLLLHYNSKRPLAHMAWGLLEKAIEHFGHPLSDETLKPSIDGCDCTATFQVLLR